MKERIAVQGRKGFTLIELLMVTAMITVLTGLFLPAVQNVKNAADELAGYKKLATLAENLSPLAEGLVDIEGDVFSMAAIAEAGTDQTDLSTFVPAVQNVSCDLNEADRVATGFQSDVKTLLQSKHLPANEVQPLTKADNALKQYLDGVHRLQALVPAWGACQGG
ncbi:MAG: type II secretion system protein [Syntrophobacteraceae bacterium]